MQLVSVDLDSVTSTRMNTRNVVCERLSVASENTDLDKALILTSKSY